MTAKLSPRLEAFLSALPHAPDDEFVNAVGLGTFRAKFVRLGMERGVVVVHSTGLGLAIRQPTSHGICHECASAKGSRTICDHCSCPMCTWFRIAEERASPRMDPRDPRLRDLMRRLKTFELGGAAQPATPPDILDDL